MLELEQTAAPRAARVLLTGQCGNAGISWAGDILSQPRSLQLRQLGWRQLAQGQRLKRRLPPAVAGRLPAAAHASRLVPRQRPSTPIRRRGCGSRERRLRRSRRARRRGRLLEHRLFLNLGGRSSARCTPRSRAAHGLEVRDPGDARVLAFTFSVPDRVFIDPQTGLDRWLIRAAMAGRLPDEVRLNRRRGRQAGRPGAAAARPAAEVETALDDLAARPGRRLPRRALHARSVWQVGAGTRTRRTPFAGRQHPHPRHHGRAGSSMGSQVRGRDGVARLAQTTYRSSTARCRRRCPPPRQPACSGRPPRAASCSRCRGWPATSSRRAARYASPRGSGGAATQWHGHLRLAPLAALLFQRGMPGVPRRGGRATDRASGAVLLAGDSGAGKSTLLAALLVARLAHARRRAGRRRRQRRWQ